MQPTPLGLLGSNFAFPIETFGPKGLDPEDVVSEAFVAEARVIA